MEINMKTYNKTKECQVRDSKPNRENEALLSGTLCATYSPAIYRTEDGEAYYRFQFIKLGEKFEIDILEQPPYRGRDESYNVAHRLPSDRGGLKVCVTAGSEPTSLEDVKKLAIGWAELTNTYIKSGITIDEQVQQNAVLNV